MNEEERIQAEEQPAAAAQESSEEVECPVETDVETPPGEAALSEAELTPEEQVAALHAELAETSDKLLRALAETDNVRKRARRELQEALRYANAPLLTELLPVLDNFGRALGPEQAGAGLEQFREGVELIHKQLEQVLERHGLAKIAAAGEPFDPMKHEALGEMDTDTVAPGHVALEAAPGYALYDRVLRATQVFVAAEPATPAECAEDAEQSVAEDPAETAESEVSEPLAEPEDGSVETA